MPIATNELANLQQSTDLSTEDFQDLFQPPRLSKPEMHLLLKPFFLLDRHADRFAPIDYRTSVIDAGKAVIRRWFVQPHALYGLPVAFDRDVTVAVYEIVNENYFSKNLSVPEVMPIGTLRDFATKMGINASGKNLTAIKESLKRLQNTLCTAEETFFDNKRKRYVSLSFRLLKGVGFAGEDDGNGFTHEQNFIVFDECILRNLNTGYVMVVDVEAFRGLPKDITKQLYTQLSYRFYRATEDGLDHWVADYDWLAIHLGIKVWTVLWRATQQLEEAHRELQEAGYIVDYRWDGWRIIYRPGPVWKGEQLRRRSGKTKHSSRQTVIRTSNNLEPTLDPLIPALALFASGLPLGEERINALGLTIDQAKDLCRERNIAMTKA